RGPLRSTLLPYTTLFRSQELGGIHKRVPVEAAVPEELGLFKAGDHAEHASLLRIGQLGLETDHVVTRPVEVLGPELDDRVGTGRSEEHTSELQSPDHIVC